MDRNKSLDKLKTEQFDILIIGGGITGAGVLRDAASRGMKAALVEAKDFASGTSSRSSKLVHGGIRYLENLEFRLVFEALSERHLLFQMAPHMVHPLRFIIPIYKSSTVSALKMGAGMWLYDLLALFRSPELHHYLNPVEIKEYLPNLNQKELVCAYEYSDAYMDDDLLNIETLRSASRMGGVAANYVSAKQIITDSQHKFIGLTVKDEFTNKEFNVTAKHLVMATGPWTDIVGKAMLPKWKPLLRPTKGVHLIFESSKIGAKKAMVMASAKDKRIVFVIPRNEITIVGTTDTDFIDNPSNVVTESSDVKYLLELLNDYFPTARVGVEDIISSYAGVRPLIHDGSGAESKTSREHYIKTSPRGITVVAGGKYTTYRLMAEQVMESALKCFSVEDQVQFLRSNTKVSLLEEISPENYQKAFSQAKFWADKFKRNHNEIVALIQKHGLGALELLEKHPDKSYWDIEAHHAIDQTMCVRLVDFFTRRSALFLNEKDHGILLLDKISKIFHERYGWDAQKLREEYAQVIAHQDFEFSWKKHI